MNADVAALAPDVIRIALQLISLGHGPAGLIATALFTFLQDGGLQKLIVAFQKFHGLPETGTVDAATQALMSRCRCAHPDVQAATHQYRWLDGNLTWAQAVNLPSVPTDVVVNAFEAAWKSWESVCGITPTKRMAIDTHLANVLAMAGEGADQGFDAANQILALSQLPDGIPITAQLTQVYNRRAAWTVEMIQAVIAHEIGHSLGLVHDGPGTLMYAYYTPGVVRPQPADVAQAVARYGPPKSVAVPPYKPTTLPFPGGDKLSIEINVPKAGAYILNLSMTPK